MRLILYWVNVSMIRQMAKWDSDLETVNSVPAYATAGSLRGGMWGPRCLWKWMV